VPVWHGLSERWREAHDLAVVGIVQEQHRERAALYAQWQGFDWPILWDPFNTTGADAVPNVYALDEAGIVRAIRPDPATFEDDFLRADFGAEHSTPPFASPAVQPLLAGALTCAEGSPEHAQWLALSRRTFAPDDHAVLDADVETLQAFADDHEDDASARFQLGVALRLRHDSPARKPGDFQAAVDAWRAALELRPGEYIWRRRIQQYGPTLDKPYPFYPWMDEALADLTARGITPPRLGARLTEAELAMPRRGAPPVAADHAEPSTAGIPIDTGWIEVEATVAADTTGRSGTARLHLTFRPTEGVAHWNNEAGPMTVWLVPPTGGSVDRTLVSLPVEGLAATTSEPRTIECEVAVPQDDEADAAPALTGFALIDMCSDTDGVCQLLRRDLHVVLTR